MPGPQLREARTRTEFLRELAQVETLPQGLVRAEDMGCPLLVLKHAQAHDLLPHHAYKYTIVTQAHAQN